MSDAPDMGKKWRKSLGCGVFRSIIDNEDLIIRKGLVENRSNRSCDFVSAVESRNDDAYRSHCHKRARNPARKRFASTKASERVPGYRARLSYAKRQRVKVR